MKTKTLPQIDADIKYLEGLIAKLPEQNDKRIIFENTVQKLKKQADLLAQSTQPVTPALTHRSRIVEDEQEGNAAPASVPPPVATNTDSEIPEQVKNYLTRREYKNDSNTTAAQSIPEKKTPIRNSATAAATAQKTHAPTEKTAVYTVKSAEHAAEYVPRYRFVTKRGGEQTLCPGTIKSRFKDRLAELSRLKKPLEYSSQFGLAAAYLAALRDYYKMEPNLRFFGFSAHYKNKIFEKIVAHSRTILIERQ